MYSSPYSFLDYIINTNIQPSSCSARRFVTGPCVVSPRMVGFKTQDWWNQWKFYYYFFFRWGSYYFRFYFRFTLRVVKNISVNIGLKSLSPVTWSVWIMISVFWCCFMNGNSCDSILVALCWTLTMAVLEWEFTFMTKQRNRKWSKQGSQRSWRII